MTLKEFLGIVPEVRVYPSAFYKGLTEAQQKDICLNQIKDRVLTCTAIHKCDTYELVLDNTLSVFPWEVSLTDDPPQIVPAIGDTVTLLTLEQHYILREKRAFEEITKAQLPGVIIDIKKSVVNGNILFVEIEAGGRVYSVPLHWLNIAQQYTTDKVVHHRI